MTEWVSDFWFGNIRQAIGWNLWPAIGWNKTFQTILKILDILTILDDFNNFRNLEKFGHFKQVFWKFLDNSQKNWQFWHLRKILDNFVQFWQLGQFWTVFTISEIFDNFYHVGQCWQFLRILTIFLEILTILEKQNYNFGLFDFFWQFLTIFVDNFDNLDNPGDVWDINYNSDNWQTEFMTILLTWQLRLTLDSVLAMFLERDKGIFRPESRS